MSYNIWFVSDHHFGHEKPYTTFLKPNGKLLRADLATNAAEGDELIVQRHNAVVKSEDRVYFVGDVCFHKKFLSTVGRMHGRKVLVKGNHDTLDIRDYLQYFDDVRGSHQFAGVLITHIPVHPQSLGRWGFNIHGHLHAERVEISPGVVDPRYFNVSVEQVNYTPISLEEVKKFKPKE